MGSRPSAPGVEIPDLSYDVPARLVAQNPNAEVEQHRLCKTCTTSISGSKILNGKARQLRQPKETKAEGRGRERSGRDYFDELGLWKSEVISEDVSHHHTFGDMVTAATDGCHLCTLLIHKMTRERGQRSDQEANIQTTLRPDEPLFFRISCSTSIHRGKLKLENGVLELRTKEDCHLRILLDQYAGDKYGDGRDKTYNYHRTASPGCFALSTSSSWSITTASQWLWDCKQYHSSCREADASTGDLPTRLVEIDKVEDGYCVKLITTTKDQTGKLPYTTLSHRWGEGQTIRLLESNHKDFLRAIDFDHLPATFRDAVIVTAGLEFRYLWIDSLCIIQDSQADWEQESAKMGEIYRGSILTIAASGAQDCHGGLFSIRNPLLHTPCRLSDQVGVRADPIHPPTDTLSSRGWILQERALACRTLFFHQGRISWECVALTREETGEKDDKSQIKNRLHALLNSKVSDFDIDPLPSSSLSLFMTYWARIVEAYSRTNLTVSSDKLVAIHGIMTKIQGAEPRLTNVAGLWKELLPAELLWRTQRENGHHQKPVANYRAPSWSWAAVDSPIAIGWPKEAIKLSDLRKRDFPESASKYTIGWEVTILEVDVVSRPNGQVSSGHIKMQGPLKRVQYLDGGEEICQLEGNLWVKDEETVSDKDELWALLVSRSMGAGIILQPVPGQDMAFRRRGYFERDAKGLNIFDADLDIKELVNTIIII